MDQRETDADRENFTSLSLRSVATVGNARRRVVSTEAMNSGASKQADAIARMKALTRGTAEIGALECR